MFSVDPEIHNVLFQRFVFVAAAAAAETRGIGDFGLSE